MLYILLKQQILRKTASVLVFSLLLLSLFSCNAQNRNSEGDLRVHFLDVGQSDASFVEYGCGACMLVDTADSERADKVCSYIDALGYSRIDTLLVTHPHSDHAGGARAVLRQFEVGRILIPKADYTTPEQEAMISEAERRGVEVITVGFGDGFWLGGAEVLFLSQDKEYADENDSSIIMKLSYGERAFLFMGDSSSESEADLIKSGIDISADAVKVGHHGSGGSSCEEFIRATGAEYAVISCSADNEYSHPSPYTVERWRKNGTSVLCTDECSDIVITTNGTELSVSSKKDKIIPAESVTGSTREYAWVLDTDSHTAHKPSCRHIKNINEENISYSNADITRLSAEGYRKCKYCIFD